MIRKKGLGLVLVFLFLIIMVCSLFSAADVAYIYKSKSKIDSNVVDIFSALSLTVEYVSEDSLPKDLSSYKLVFIGDEYFTESIPIENYKTIVFNHYIEPELGLTNNNGASVKTSSTKPLEVDFKGNNVQVYTSARSTTGNFIPYYFLNKYDKACSVQAYAETPEGSAKSGDVVAFADKGDVLSNGKTAKGNICFFGIVKSDYWTSDAEDLFTDCVNYVMFSIVPSSNDTITCSKNSDCGTDGYIESNFCSGGNIVRNYKSYTCNNPGTISSSCSSQTSQRNIQNCSNGCTSGVCNQEQTIECSQNNDCNDNNSNTEDICLNPGTGSSQCIHNIYNNIIKIVSLTASSTTDSVTLSFSASPGNDSTLSGFLLSKDKTTWNLVSVPVTSYTYSGLSASTDYVFYAKAIDNLNRSSDEVNISIRTQDIPATPVSSSGGGGGGGGSISGSSSWCVTKWNCTDWSVCKNGIQTRTCGYASNFCEPVASKPDESQSCSAGTSEANTNTSLSGTNTAENKTSSNGFLSPITGAVVGAFGKHKWLWIVVFLAIIIVLYIIARARKAG